MLFNLLLMYFEDLSGTGFLRSSPTKNRVYGTSVLNPPPPFPSNETLLCDQAAPPVSTEPSACCSATA